MSRRLWALLIDFVDLDGGLLVGEGCGEVQEGRDVGCCRDAVELEVGCVGSVGDERDTAGLCGGAVDPGVADHHDARGVRPALANHAEAVGIRLEIRDVVARDMVTAGERQRLLARNC